LSHACKLCLCPCAITPRGFTSLQEKELEYGFSGFIPTNKKTNKAYNASDDLQSVDEAQAYKHTRSSFVGGLNCTTLHFTFFLRVGLKHQNSLLGRLSTMDLQTISEICRSLLPGGLRLDLGGARWVSGYVSRSFSTGPKCIGLDTWIYIRHQSPPPPCLRITTPS